MQFWLSQPSLAGCRYALGICHRVNAVLVMPEACSSVEVGGKHISKRCAASLFFLGLGWLQMWFRNLGLLVVVTPWVFVVVSTRPCWQDTACGTPHAPKTAAKEKPTTKKARVNLPKLGPAPREERSSERTNKRRARPTAALERKSQHRSRNDQNNHIENKIEN